MRCWLTTHYPHYVADKAEWFIYVRRGFEHLVSKFDKGDRVAFYEVGEGPDREGIGRRPRGGKGVKCLATATGVPQPATFQERYEDGTSTDFTLECRCDNHDFTHWLAMNELFGALGRKLALRGLGGGAGFIELSTDEFSRVEAVFLAADRG